MLRSILSAIRFALSFLFRFIGRVMSLPGQLLGHVLGVPGTDDVPVMAAPEDLSAGSELSANWQETYELIANLVRTWCADSLIGDRPAPLPPRLPRAVKEWLPGLTRDECDAVINADKYAVVAHCSGLYDIVGVRRVGRLPALSEWPPEPPTTSAPDVSAPALAPPVTRFSVR